jgi:hypothetical protein
MNTTQIRAGMNAGGTAPTWSVGLALGATAGNPPPHHGSIYSVPNWVTKRGHDSYWTEEWRQKELLADFDWIVGNVFEADDIDEMIRQLHEAVDEADQD